MKNCYPDNLEQHLTSIWEETLKIFPVGIHDNFFDLGGNSMLALSLLKEVEKQFDCKISLVKLFQAQTVAQQAEIICQNKG